MRPPIIIEADFHDAAAGQPNTTAQLGQIKRLAFILYSANVRPFMQMDAEPSQSPPHDPDDPKGESPYKFSEVKALQNLRKAYMYAGPVLSSDPARLFAALNARTRELFPGTTPRWEMKGGDVAALMASLEKQTIFFNL